MFESNPRQRILIASSHPLFGKGLQSLLEERWGETITIVGIVSSIGEALDALTTLEPDLLIVDSDAIHLNGDEFLGHFIKSKVEIRVVLLSLHGDIEAAEAIVYDRRTMSASKIEDWLDIRPTKIENGSGV